MRAARVVGTPKASNAFRGKPPDIIEPHADTSKTLTRSALTSLV